MPLIIGVAGAIATGKSSACKMLEGLGATHCDADKLVHTLYEPGKPAFDRIVETFGDEVVGDDGYIDRRILGAKVFGKPEEMKKLSTAIGNIAEAAKQVVDGWKATMGPHDVALLEAVSLMEAGYGQWCHQVWLFASDPALARQRLMARNNFTAEEADQRLASQRAWEDRAPGADVVLFNDGDVAEFERRVRDEYDRVCDLWRRDDLPTSVYYAWWEETGQYIRNPRKESTAEQRA